MSPPVLSIGEEEGKSNVTLLVSSSTTMESVCLKSLEFKERNYMGLSDCSSVDSSVPSFSEETKSNLNLKATELRLGLPGSQSPDRDSDLCLRSSTQFDEKTLFPLRPLTDDHHSSAKTAVLGNKRGFSDAMNGFSSEGKFLVDSEAANPILSPRPASNLGLKPGSTLEKVGVQQTKMKEVATTKANEARPTIDGSALFVKVSMDGAPYLRKVDLKNYSTYPELSSALEKMFSCFTMSKCGSHGILGREMLNETKLKDLLHGSEYVLTYEDREGDWMLVGDVPWEMFIETCKRLRIMKSSDAIGLAPRAVEKCKSRT